MSVAIPGGLFDAEKHIYTDGAGRRIASVTQVLALLGMVNYGFVKEEVLERKSQLGVATHAAIQYLSEGVLDWDTVPEEVMPRVVAAEIWHRDQGFECTAQEEQGIHILPGGMAYGYMFDALGTVMYKGRKRHVIVDYKTTVVISPCCTLQTAAYALAAPKLPAGERYLRCILQLKADGSFRPHYYEDRQDELSWQYALHTCIWGINNGLYTLEAA